MDRRSGLRDDDRGQLFLLAGIVLALALITISTVVTTNVHTPARQLDAQRPVALQSYEDVKSTVRAAVQYHLDSFGATNRSLREAVQRLRDPARLGLVGRNVDVVVRLNGTRERELCNESPPYGSADLDEFAEKSGPDCSHDANADGAIVDGDGDVLAAVVDVGLVDPRYTVSETIVVRSIPDRFYLRRVDNTKIGATVDDSPSATDYSDGVFHQVRSPNPNIPQIDGYAAIPHSMYSGAEDLGQDRDANWSVAVANPTEEPLEVTRVEIVEVDGNVAWEENGVETMLHPRSDWSVQQDDTVTSVIDNANFKDRLTGWNDTYKDVADAAEYGVRDDTVCQLLHVNNDCMKLKTVVPSSSTRKIAWYTLNQSFTAPTFDEAEITFDYNLKASDTLLVDNNNLYVNVTDSDGNTVYTFSDTSKSTVGWTGRSYEFPSNFTSGETYNLTVEARQNVPSAAVEVNATSWVDDIYINFTTVATQRIVWNGPARSIPSGAATNFSVQVKSNEPGLTAPTNLTFRSRVKAKRPGGAYEWYELDAADVGTRSRPYETVRGDTKPTVTVALNRTDYSVTVPAVENSGFEDGNASWTHEHDVGAATVHGVRPCPARPPPDNDCVAMETTVASDGSRQQGQYWLNQTFTTPDSFASAELVYDHHLDADGADNNGLHVNITSGGSGVVTTTQSGSTGWSEHAEDVTSKLDPSTTYTLRIHGHQAVSPPASGSSFANASIDDVFVNFTREASTGTTYKPTWFRPVESSSTVSLQFAVGEASKVNAIPDHYLDIYVPSDWKVEGYNAGSCGASDCYDTTPKTIPKSPTTIDLEDFGTIYRFTSKTGGFAAGEFGTVTVNVTAPGVREPSLYRFPLQVGPLDSTLGYPYARSDALLQVVPKTSTPHTLQMLYHSENVVEDVDGAALRGLEVGVDASASRRMNVTMQLWRWTSADGWTWHTLRQGVVDFEGVSWRPHLRIAEADPEKRLGVMDDAGVKALEGKAAPGTIAIRFLHGSDRPYRFNVDLTYYRIEHV